MPPCSLAQPLRSSLRRRFHSRWRRQRLPVTTMTQGDPPSHIALTGPRRPSLLQHPSVNTPGQRQWWAVSGGFQREKQLLCWPFGKCFGTDFFSLMFSFSLFEGFQLYFMNINILQISIYTSEIRSNISALNMKPDTVYFSSVRSLVMWLFDTLFMTCSYRLVHS